MNLAIRGIDGQIAHGDTFHNDRHPDLKADFILANPPFNVSDWGGERLTDDKRWQYGVPPRATPTSPGCSIWCTTWRRAARPASCSPTARCRRASLVRARLEKTLIEADQVDCMVALPGQLFYSTQIPACLWFLARDRRNGKLRDRRGEVLFIDTRKLGRMVDRTHRELTNEDIARITDTYHAWRGEKMQASTPTHLASASRRHWRRYASTATCLRPAATSARKRKRTTASRSRTR